MPSSAKSVRVLLVDDYTPWRESAQSILANHKELYIVAEAADGVEAVQTAEVLQPDLILLDIGLPKLNGIEAARRIRKVSPQSRILFVSENRSSEIAEEALHTGASGYVTKSDAMSDLFPAIQAVLNGKRFVSASLLSRDLSVATDHHTESRPSARRMVAPLPPENRQIHHEVEFYPDDAAFMEGFARLIKTVLQAKNPIIAITTERHRVGILQRLKASGVDVSAAIEQGTYIPLDVVETLPTLMVANLPDPIRCEKMVGDLIVRAAKGAQREDARVAICGEVAPTLLASGNADAAIRLEHLWDEITKEYHADTLCGYVSSAFPHEKGLIFEKICAEHSAVQGRPLGY
jgi:DNA-binding NarL/FixJ family response regulator